MPNIYDPSSVISKKRKDINSSSLRFPYDNTIDSNYTIISFYEYTRVNPLDTPKNELNTHIILPLPSQGLSDSNSMKYSEAELGTAIGGSLATLGGNGGGFGGFLGGAAAAIGTSVMKSAIGAASELLTEGVNKAVSTINPNTNAKPVNINLDKSGKLAGMVSGVALNPNMSLAFDGVNLRTHRFSWRLVAKTPDESIAIKNIVNKLKQLALPKKTAGSAFALSYPYICDIDFNPDVIKISSLKCFLTDILVNYDGDGHPSFYKDTNAPVIVDLQLEFKERYILTSEDYE